MDIDEAPWDAAAAGHDRAAALLAAGDARAAEAEARAALVALEDVLGPDHPDVANALDTLATSLEPAGGWSDALALRRRAGALLARWRDAPAADPIAAHVLRRLAYTLVQAGAYAEAAARLDEATAAARRAYGDPSVEVADCVHLAGVLARMRGRLDEAGRAYDEAGRLYLRAGATAPATLLHNLGGLACARGEYAAAERHARAAVEARRLEAPASEVGLAGDLAGLADALVGLGRLPDAAATYRDALTRLAEAGLEAHPEAAYARHALADVLADLGEPAEALARKAALFGRVHHEVAATLNNLAALLAEAGRTDEARAASDEAVAIVEATLDPAHPVWVGCVALATRLRG